MNTKLLVTIFTIALLLAALLMLFAADPVREQWYRYINTYAVDHYKKNLAVFHQRVAQNLPSDTVLFYGDSLIQGLAVESVAPRAVNFGIGHATVQDVLRNIQRQADLRTVDAIVLAVGVNDVLAGNGDKVWPGYKEIVDVIPRETALLISLIAPVDQKVRPNIPINATIAAINVNLQSLCETYANVTCLAWADEVSTSDGQLASEFHIGDGLHLNRLGNAIWIDKLKSTLQYTLSEKAKAQ